MVGRLLRVTGTVLVIAVAFVTPVLATSTSAGADTVANLIPTSTFISSWTHLSMVGQSAVYTAIVGPTRNLGGPDEITGTIAFTDNGSPIAGCTAIPLSNDSATCSTTPATAGGHNIVATYSGSEEFYGSTSQPVTEVVTRTPCHALAGCNLEGLDLSDAVLNGANLTDTNLQGANLTGARLQSFVPPITNLTGANLQGANLFGANLAGANLAGANLRGANASDIDLEQANLAAVPGSTVTNLSGANLQHANLISADLSGANLSGANLQLAAIGSGTFYGLPPTNLSGANLQGDNLSFADLEGVDLAGANLSRANLTNAGLGGADLSGANMTGTTLTGADFSGTVLVPSDQTTPATSSAGAVATWTTPPSLPGATPGTCTPPSGSTFPMSDTTVTCQVLDDQGNVATGTFIVAVS